MVFFISFDRLWNFHKRSRQLSGSGRAHWVILHPSAEACIFLRRERPDENPHIMNIIDYDSTLQEKKGEITLFCCAGIHVLPKLLGRSCLRILPTGARKHFLFIASPRPARTPRRRGSRCARAAAGRAAAPAPGHRPRRPASVQRFGRVSGPLSSWRGPRTALNRSYRGDIVARV